MNQAMPDERSCGLGHEYYVNHHMTIPFLVNAEWRHLCHLQKVTKNVMSETTENLQVTQIIAKYGLHCLIVSVT